MDEVRAFRDARPYEAGSEHPYYDSEAEPARPELCALDGPHVRLRLESGWEATLLFDGWEVNRVAMSGSVSLCFEDGGWYEHGPCYAYRPRAGRASEPASAAAVRKVRELAVKLAEKHVTPELRESARIAAIDRDLWRTYRKMNELDRAKRLTLDRMRQLRTARDNSGELCGECDTRWTATDEQKGQCQRHAGHLYPHARRYSWVPERSFEPRVSFYSWGNAIEADVEDHMEVRHG